MDRITDHHLRVIRIGIIAFSSILIVAFGGVIGHGIYNLSNHTAVNISRVSSVTELDLDLTKPKPKHPAPKEIQSLIITCLIFAELINIGLLIGTVKHCKCLMRVWLAKALVMCFLGVYGIILEFFGSEKVDGLIGTGCIIGVLLYVVFIVLVWIFHEKGDQLITHTSLDNISTHNLINPEPLI